MAILIDPWSREGSIPLEGKVEKWEMPPWLMALIVAIVLWFGFQLIGGIAAVIIHMASGGDFTDFANVENLGRDTLLAMLRGNTVGQFVGLAAPVFLLAWLSTTKVGEFLRIRRTSFVSIILALLGLAALMPVVQWLGSLNSALPIPEAIREFEETLSAPIREIIGIKSLVVANIFMVAVTPAICEELLFRGYIQRQLERSTGVVVAVVLTGLMFGFYHLQLSQVIPLATLGIYMAYLTWITGSLIPAILVHLANNSFAILMSVYAEESDNISPEELATMSVPWYWVVAGFIGLAVCVRLLNQHTHSTLVERTRAKLT